MENKIIFSVTKTDDGSAIKLETSSTEELFTVALGIHDAIKRCPDLTFMLSCIIAMDKNEEFKKAVEDSTVEIPNFNDILKNIK